MKQSLLGAPAAEAKRLSVTPLLEWKAEFKHYFREGATVREEPGARAEMGNENRKHSQQFVQRLLNLKLVPTQRTLHETEPRSKFSPTVHTKIRKGIVHLPWEGSNPFYNVLQLHSGNQTGNPRERSLYPT